MQSWIVLFRGVNVGGHRRLPMKELCGALEKAGFEGVRSYIQSGNVVLKSAGDADKVGRAVGAVVRQHFGFECEALVLGDSDLAKIIGQAPFPDGADPSRCHVFFHLAGQDVPDAAELAPGDGDTAALWRGEGVHYLATPDGMAQSKLADFLARRIGQVSTGRNLRTCKVLLEMAAQ